MEIRVLQYFLAVAREQSIIKAAQSLHLSQPTLSTQLKSLENELGKQLLIRGTKGSRKVTLTEEGMILRQRAEEIINLVKKTEKEIILSDNVIAGDIYIGTGETDAVRFIARTAKTLQKKYPNIHYHISSGNAEFVKEQLDKGLIDFGIIFDPIDEAQYEYLRMPYKDNWGVLMRRDCPLAQKETITPEDLKDKPLIISKQENERNNLPFMTWLKHDFSKLNIVGTYNLLFNASLMVEEGVGYALCLDKIINTCGSSLCFRPLYPKIEAEMSIIWKKYQILSKAADKFITQLQQIF